MENNHTRTLSWRHGVSPSIILPNLSLEGGTRELESTTDEKGVRVLEKVL